MELTADIRHDGISNLPEGVRGTYYCYYQLLFSFAVAV